MVTLKDGFGRLRNRSHLDSILEISSLHSNLRSPLSVRIPDCPICQGTADGLCAPRHVDAWSDLTASEQFGMLAHEGQSCVQMAEENLASAILKFLVAKTSLS